MRYHEGSAPGEMGEPVSNLVEVGTAVYSLILGVGFVVAGWRFKQRWMVVWGAGLSIVSVIYLALLGRG